MRRLIVASLVAHLLIAGAWMATADHLEKGYVRPDPVPAFQRQPCQTDDRGIPYWNCYYDRDTMYDKGDTKHSYYQVRAHTQDGKGKYVCFLYWKQEYARDQNVCIEW